ncbi:MAG: tetratricopeptide repeat protein [Myxococcota bacterium]
MPTGTWTLDGEARRPVRAIGVDPLVQLLVPFPGGRLQVTQQAFAAADGERFDVFADGRAPGEWGHWTGGGMTWNAQCAACHATGVRQGYDERTDTYDTQVAALGVGCAACHGDLAAHAASGAPVDAEPVGLDTCAGCHARRAELVEAIDPGAPLLDQFAPLLVDGGDAFWPDGQVRGEDFEYTAFVGSGMHAAGVTCTGCHTIRTAAGCGPRATPCASAATRAWRASRRTIGTARGSDVSAATCPSPPTCSAIRATTTASWCPTRRGARRSASPTRATAAMPTAAPPGSRVEAWYGDLAGAARRRATAVSAARAVFGAVAPLAMLREEQPAWRASAALLLQGYVDREPVRAAPVEALGDADPLVRFGAAGGRCSSRPPRRRGPALAAALDDPRRAVRVQASRALAGSCAPMTRGRDYAAYLAHNVDTPSALHRAGHLGARPGRRRGCGGRPDARRAARRPVRSLRDGLALALARDGQPERAAAELREAVALAPDDGELWFRLGLAEAGRGALPEAAQALERATALAPDAVRAWYNLGLLEQQLGAGAEAVAALQRAVALAPEDGDVGYALASTLLAQGDRRGARREAERVLRVAGDHDGARALLAAL